MGAVTIAAHGNARIALHPLLAVDGSAVERELIGRNPVRLHLHLIRVTARAEFHNLLAIEGALEVVGMRACHGLSLRISSVAVSAIDPLARVSAVLKLDLLVAVANRTEVIRGDFVAERTLGRDRSERRA